MPNYYRILLIIVLLSSKLLGQNNLVSNGNFENYKDLPKSLLIAVGLQDFLINVFTPYLGNTPDYYNYQNSINQIKYPNLIYPPNFLFKTTADSIYKKIVPKSGDGFIGISNELGYYPSSSNPYSYFIENIGLNLNKPLIKNHKYSGSFFYNNFGRQSFIIVDLGMLIIKDTEKIKIKSQSDWSSIYYDNVAQLKNKSGKIISKDIWVQIKNTFKAVGGEQTTMIGYFKSVNSIEDLDSSYALIDPVLSTYRFRNYFFIDSVTLYEIPCLVAQDTACKGDSIYFYHTFAGNAIWTTHADSTQQIISTDSVYSFVASQSGWYYVFTPNGKDSTYLTVIETPTLTLGSDTFVCEAESVNLLPIVTNSISYLWNTGANTASLSASSQGWYWLKASNAGCSVVDSIYITQQPLPSKLSQHEFLICTATGSFETILLNSDYKYTWQTLTDTLNEITFYKEGCEKVTIVSQYGCTTKDEVCITDRCKANIFVPNAFAPNGVNKVFKPVTKYVDSIHWKVYNKWGQLIFETNDLIASWDGTFNNEPCPNDVYFYTIQYTGIINTGVQIVSGNVTLIR